MFRPRSYVAFAIAPQPPIMDWLSELDANLERSEGFFAGQHVALDLAAVNLSSSAIGQLVAWADGHVFEIEAARAAYDARHQPG